jgi:hypothetical protein
MEIRISQLHSMKLISVWKKNVAAETVKNVMTTKADCEKMK